MAVGTARRMGRSSILCATPHRRTSGRNGGKPAAHSETTAVFWEMLAPHTLLLPTHTQTMQAGKGLAQVF